jgi:hypothetical protein
MALWSRRKLFAGLGGAAAVAAATQLPRTAAAATAGATIVLVSPPERIADTRADGTGKVSAAHPLDMFVGGLIGDGVVGALLNITVTETEGSGFLAATADNASSPNPTSNINWSATGQNLANLAIVPAVGTRGITIRAGGPGQTHVVVDLVGFLMGA